MKRIELRIFIMMLTGILLIGSTQIFAQNENKNCQGKGKGPGMNCMIPDLTEAQQKKIEELKLAHQKNMMQFKSQLDIKYAQLQALSTADKADMNAINKIIDEIGAIKVQKMKEKENHRQQIRAQLTDAQRLQFDMHRGKGMGKCFGPGCHQGKNGMGMHGNKVNDMGPGGR